MKHEMASVPHEFMSEVKALVEKTRNTIAQEVNQQMTYLYWQLGKRINEEVLQGQRADYGKKIVTSLSRQLTADYGKSFSEKNLRKMMQFSAIFPDENNVAPLMRQLSWTHFTLLIPIADEFERDFYIQMCALEKWSVRTLRNRIDSMLFQRSALSKKPQELIRQELAQLNQNAKLTPELVLKDPYVLDFLELSDHYFEKDFEDAILRQLEQFLLELGSGFSFIARQKRIHIGQEDFYIDLLFYNRKLKCLIAIDLKLGKFKAEYKGQMELYLRYLAKHETEPEERAPLGIILCAAKDQEQIELLELDQSGIHIAEYLTVLPDKNILKQKLQQAIQQSRNKLQD